MEALYGQQKQDWELTMAQFMNFLLPNSDLNWNLSWIFIGRTYAEVETPRLCWPDTKKWLTGKDLDTGKDWKQEDKGTMEDEMVGWHHRLDGHEQAPGVDDGQGSPACCSPWGHRVRHDSKTELTDYITQDCS